MSDYTILDDNHGLSQKPDIYEKDSFWMWGRSLVSFAFFIVLFYLIIPSWTFIAGLTAILLIHETGHFIAMKLYGYRNVGMFFIPLFGAYVSGSKEDPDPVEEVVTYMAGPVPGLVLGMLLFLIPVSIPGLTADSVAYLAFGFLALNWLNLIPIYPLDGGRVLEKLLPGRDSTVRIVLLSTTVTLCFVYSLIAGLGIISIFGLFLLMNLLRLIRWTRFQNRLIRDHLPLNQTWSALSDEDYQLIKDALVRVDPSLLKKSEKEIGKVINGLLEPGRKHISKVYAVLLTLVVWLAFLILPVIIMIYYKPQMYFLQGF